MIRAATAALLLLAACVSATSGDPAAALRAREDAQRDLARGRPRDAFIGFVPDDRSALDPATGLVKFSVGCCPTRELMAYRDAYNDAVRSAAPAGLARKATTRADVEALFAGGRGEEIRLGAPGANSPDGRFHVEVAPGVGRDAIALWSTDATTGERSELRYLGGHDARIVFGADGLTPFVRDDVVRAYATFDLPSALFLEVFPDPPRER